MLKHRDPREFVFFEHNGDPYTLDRCWIAAYDENGRLFMRTQVHGVVDGLPSVVTATVPGVVLVELCLISGRLPTLAEMDAAILFFVKDMPYIPRNSFITLGCDDYDYLNMSPCS